MGEAGLQRGFSFQRGHRGGGELAANRELLHSNAGEGVGGGEDRAKGASAKQKGVAVLVALIKGEGGPRDARHGVL